MKLLSTIIFLISGNILFAQDTLKNNFPIYFISQIEIRYELFTLKKLKSDPRQLDKYFLLSNLHKTIKPFSPAEFPPYFNLELDEEDIFEFQSGFEMEAMNYFLEAENNIVELTSDDQYPNSSWIFTTNFDKKESANFYNLLAHKNASYLKIQVSVSSLFYQKEKFLRSVFDWNLKRESRKINFNISYINNIFYHHESNTAIGMGNRRYVFFPKKYHEERMNEWAHSNQIIHSNFSESAIFAKLLLNPFKKTYFKVESDWHWFFVSNDQRIRRRYRTIGIGVKPIDGTIIFLEYTNRRIGFDHISNFLYFEEKPYFSLYATQNLKFRLFKR